MGCFEIKGDKEEVDNDKRMRKTNKEIEKQIKKNKDVCNEYKIRNKIKK